MTHSCKAMTVRGNEQAKRYLDVDELTSQSGLSHATIWRLKAAGKIPFYQPAGKGGRVTFPPDALERTGQNEAPAFPQDAADSSPSKQLPGPRPQWMSSLGTRDREDALRRLRDLDRYKAIEHGLVQPDRPAPSEDVGIDDGWRLYMERCEQPEILEGVSPETRKRYRAVRDKHVKFCAEKAYRSWSEMTKKTTTEYGNWLAKKDRADRTIVLELNLICSIVKWLVEEKRLPSSCRFLLKLSKPEGSTTHCYTREQVTRMVDFCYAIPTLIWLAQVITSLATSGLRINELAKLRWSDIDFQSATIRLTDERSRPRRKQSGQERRINPVTGTNEIHPPQIVARQQLAVGVS